MSDNFIDIDAKLFGSRPVVNPTFAQKLELLLRGDHEICPACGDLVKIDDHCTYEDWGTCGGIKTYYTCQKPGSQLI